MDTSAHEVSDRTSRPNSSPESLRRCQATSRSVLAAPTNRRAAPAGRGHDPPCAPQLRASVQSNGAARGCVPPPDRRAGRSHAPHIAQVAGTPRESRRWPPSSPEPPPLPKKAADLLEISRRADANRPMRRDADAAPRVGSVRWTVSLSFIGQTHPPADGTVASPQRDGRSGIYPQVSLGFSNETVTWPLAARAKWSTSRYLTVLPSEPVSVIEPVNVELLLRSFTLKLPQNVACPV